MQETILYCQKYSCLLQARWEEETWEASQGLRSCLRQVSWGQGEIKKKKKDAEDPQDIPEDIPFMNEDEVSIFSLFSFFESDNKISLESLGVPEESAIPTVLEEKAITSG